MGYHYRVSGFGQAVAGCVPVSYVDKAGRTGSGNLCADSSGRCGDPFALQYALQYLGYGPIDVDGIIGPQTINALKNYAAANSIPYAGGAPGPELCTPIMAQYSGESAPAAPTAPAAPPKLNITAMPMTKTISTSRSGLYTGKRNSAMSTTSTEQTASPYPTPSTVGSWWSSLPTWQKYAIVGGGVAAAGTGAYFLFLRKPKATPNRRRRRHRRR